MGTVTVKLDADPFSPIDGSNAGYAVRGQITMSSSYATGGDTVNASSFGLGIITKMNFSGTQIGAGASAYMPAPVYNSGGQAIKVQAFGGAASGVPLAEVTNATNLSTVVFDVIAWGT